MEIIWLSWLDRREESNLFGFHGGEWPPLFEGFFSSRCFARVLLSRQTGPLHKIVADSKCEESEQAIESELRPSVY